MSAPPQLWIIAGPNGSGKSTLTRNYFQARGIPIPLVNPDDILRENPGSSHLHAGKQAIARQGIQGWFLATATRLGLFPGTG